MELLQSVGGVDFGPSQSTVLDQFKGLDFFDAVFFSVLLEDSTALHFFGMFAWCVRNDRNNWVFNKMCKGPERLLVEAVGYLEDFDAVHGADGVLVIPPSPVKVAPLAGWLKIKCDASLVEDSVGMGIGCCVRNAGGNLIRASSIHKNISVSVLVAELLAIGEGVVLAIDAGAQKIIVESDCKSAIDLILSPAICLNEFGTVLGNILDFSKQTDIIFSFVPRNCNKVAHDLVRHALLSFSSES